MTMQMDCSVAIKKESVYGTAVTVDRFFETTSAAFEAKPEYKPSAGHRPGKRAPRGSSVTLVKKSGSGSLELEASASGLGLLLEAAFGESTITEVPTGTSVFQQVHTPTDTDYLPAYTVQIGTPLLGGGAVQAATYKGAQCESIKFTGKAGDHLMVATEWMAKDYATDIAYQAPSYPVDLSLFSFIHGAIYAGGVLTPPTTTALASMTGTALANLADYEIQWANGLDAEGFNLGGAGTRTRPSVVTKGELSGSITAEYDSNTFRDAWLNNVDMTLLLDFRLTEEIATGIVPVLQIAIPLVKLTGEMPKDAGGEVIKQKFSIAAFDAEDGTSQLVYVVYRSLDTAL